MSPCRMVFFLAAAALFVSSPAAGGLFQATCATTPCPSISWADAPAGQKSVFVLTSSKRADSMNNWVAFGFGTSTGMTSTIFVFDCYDINGTIATGTSKNLAGDNVDYPADLPKFTNRVATLIQNVYTCTFSTTLPSTAVYAIIAEGKMNSSLTTPKKLYHGTNRYSSSLAFTFSSAVTRMSSPFVVAVALAFAFISLRPLAGR